jgi:dihydrofolate reductase
MRQVRYSVAMSLDGYIAGPGGEFDWVVADPAVDFAAFFRKVDTVVMGRGTFEVAQRQAPDGGLPGMKTVVISRTLRPEDYPGVTVSPEAVSTVRALRDEEGKDIWLMGGGKLFHALLEAGLVDLVEVGLMPILLGQGIPLLPTTSRPTRLTLTRHEVFASGIVLLRYEVERDHA